MARRPFGDPGVAAGGGAGRVVRARRSDWREAFAHHPRIGDRDALRARSRPRGICPSASSRAWTAADADVLRRSPRATGVYEQPFGYIFIVCATGRTAARCWRCCARGSATIQRRRDSGGRRRAGQDHGAAIERDCVRGGWRCSRPAARVTGLGAFMPGCERSLLALVNLGVLDRLALGVDAADGDRECLSVGRDAEARSPPCVAGFLVRRSGRGRADAFEHHDVGVRVVPGDRDVFPVEIAGETPLQGAPSPATPSIETLRPGPAASMVR